MGIFDAVEYIIAGNIRMGLNTPVAAGGEGSFPVDHSPAAAWRGNVSSGNQTFKPVNRTL